MSFICRWPAFICCIFGTVSATSLTRKSGSWQPNSRRAEHPAIVQVEHLREFEVPENEVTTALIRSEVGDRHQAERLPITVQGGSIKRLHSNTSKHAVSAIVSSRGIKYLSLPNAKMSGKPMTMIPEAVSSGENVGLAALGATLAKTSQAANDTVVALASDLKPHVGYFAGGVAAFLLATALMIAYTQSLGYRRVGEDVVLFENPQESADLQASASAAVSSREVRRTHPGEQIEYRLQQVLISWIFIVASVVYFLYYLALQASLENVRHWFGVVASMQWLFGFVLHLHWQFSVGDPKMQLFGTVLKILACILSQIHPFAMIMGEKETDAMVWWPAVAGIAAWHLGNLVACASFAMHPPNGFNRQGSPVTHGNIPVTEMWVDQMATWLLLIAAFITTDWKGQPELQLTPTKSWIVVVCQFGGATFFLMASVLRCEWCNGFRNCSHQRP